MQAPPVRPLLHIGYHKTGTTWMQKRLFTKTELGFSSPFTNKEILERLTGPHALDFDAASCRLFSEERLRPVVTSGLVPVVSRERFSGEVHIGSPDVKEMADRLRAVFPDGRVLIVIREQRSVILSIYNQHVKISSSVSLADYLRPSARSRRGFRLDHFRYDRLIRST